MKNVVLGIILRVLIAPVWVVSVLAMLVLYPFWGADLSWREGVLVLRCKPESWFSKSRFLGACWGHGVILAAQATEEVLRHEQWHRKQIEANGIAGLVIGIAPAIGIHWVLGLLTWALVPVLCYLGGMLAAVLRGEHPYYGNHNEEAARAAAER